MPKQTIYTVGGTVQAGGGIYIKRKADDELLELCREGKFAFILSSRQVGKSSLMVRTAQQLEKENIRSVTIDLSAIGVKVSAEEWYLGILNEIVNSLNLQADIFSWWEKYTKLGPAQRMTNFFKEVLLKEVQESIVLFFDEIDSTLSIPFSDDFYVAIRSVYNARSTVPEFRRLSFVLVGVAAPSELIADNKRTPFNLGQRVEITDFTLTEALPLAEGLGDHAIDALTWVFHYTGGHPYLTQRLCAYLASLKGTLDQETVAQAVKQLFTGGQGKHDNNLQFVRDMLTKRSPDAERVFSIYKDIRSGKTVLDDERSITKAHLKLSGLVLAQEGVLKVRNQIYNTVFDREWVKEHAPRNRQRALIISLSAVLGTILLLIMSVLVYDAWVGIRRNSSVTHFISTTDPAQRLADLAKIYSRDGILTNTDSSLVAAQLFYGLSTSREQIDLFRDYAIKVNPKLQDDLVVVVRHLYVTLATVDPGEDTTALLDAMNQALSNIPEDNEEAADLRSEITAWLDGRQKLAEGNVAGALLSYNTAVFSNPSNQATLYERAQVYVTQENYPAALKDLDAAIAAAKESAPDIPPTPTPTIVFVLTTNTPFAFETPATAPGASPATSIAGETQVIPTPTAVVVTATPTPAVTPEPTAPPPGRIPEKFESNFTTLINVVNEIRTLIENTRGLQVALQSSAEGEYANLSSYGLIALVSVDQTPARLPTTRSAPNGTRAAGVDVSAFDGGINWARVKASGVEFAFIKATEGIDQTDTFFENNWGSAGSVGIARGAYHYFHADLDPLKQADFFISIVDGTGDAGDLPPVLVLDNAFGQDNATVVTNVRTWLDYVEKSTGRKPMIFSNEPFLGRSLTDAKGQPPDWVNDYPLWLAMYPDLRSDLDSMEPFLPDGWSQWTFWQYSANGLVDGINSSRVDLNVFNGSDADLQDFIVSSGGAVSQEQIPLPTFPLPTTSEALPTLTLGGNQTVVMGPDISFYNDDPATPQGIDFEKMRQSAQFVIIRAGQNLAIDPDFRTNWQEAKLAGLPRGAYWFYDSRADPERQADLWINEMGNDLGELPLFADFEEQYRGTYSGPENWVLFLERVKALTNGTKEIAIYTAYYAWSNGGPTSSKDLEYFNQFSLWIAAYGTDKPQIPAPWSEDGWLFWEYTDGGEAPLYGLENDRANLNYFNGDLNTFRTRFDLTGQ